MLTAIIIAIGMISVLRATMSCDARGFDEPASRRIIDSVAPEPTILAIIEAIKSSFQRILLLLLE